MTCHQVACKTFLGRQRSLRNRLGSQKSVLSRAEWYRTLLAACSSNLEWSKYGTRKCCICKATLIRAHWQSVGTLMQLFLEIDTIIYSALLDANWDNRSTWPCDCIMFVRSCKILLQYHRNKTASKYKAESIELVWTVLQATWAWQCYHLTRSSSSCSGKCISSSEQIQQEPSQTETGRLAKHWAEPRCRSSKTALSVHIFLEYKSGRLLVLSHSSNLQVQERDYFIFKQVGSCKVILDCNFLSVSCIWMDYVDSSSLVSTFLWDVWHSYSNVVGPILNTLNCSTSYKWMHLFSAVTTSSVLGDSWCEAFVSCLMCHLLLYPT